MLSVLFSTKDKRRGKIGVSNGMKPRTQILDKTQKRSESEQVDWASTRFIQACVVQAHEWGGQVELSNHISNKRDGLFD